MSLIYQYNVSYLLMTLQASFIEKINIGRQTIELQSKQYHDKTHVLQITLI